MRRLGLRATARLALVLLLAACAEPRVATQTPRVNLSGYSAEFKEGYAHGCASAGGPVKRDAARFEADPGYARGWNDGYAICKR